MPTFSALVAELWFLFSRLDFQCRYYGHEVVSLVAEVNTVPPPLPVAAPGPLRVELRLASGQCEAKGAKGVHGCTDGKHRNGMDSILTPPCPSLE